MPAAPTFKYEKELEKAGYRAIVGVDEAGTGALAGPVLAGAVVFPFNSRLGAVKDSKLLLESHRESLFDEVVAVSHAWAAGQASVQEIADLGLRQATYLAMRRAIEQIAEADFVLVDAWTIPGLAIPQKGIIKGDRQVKSIAAASIIAKVTRDRIMRELAEAHPRYGFDVHKGYATAVHRAAIKEYGPCEHHRLNYRTFAP